MEMLKKETEQRQAIEMAVHGYAGTAGASFAEDRRGGGFFIHI